MDSGWELDIGCIEFKFVWCVVRDTIWISRSKMNKCKDGPEETEIIVVVNVGCSFSRFDVGR